MARRVLDLERAVCEVRTENQTPRPLSLIWDTQMFGRSPFVIFHVSRVVATCEIELQKEIFLLPDLGSASATTSP